MLESSQKDFIFSYVVGGFEFKPHYTAEFVASERSRTISASKLTFLNEPSMKRCQVRGSIDSIVFYISGTLVNSTTNLARVVPLITVFNLKAMSN